MEKEREKGRKEVVEVGRGRGDGRRRGEQGEGGDRMWEGPGGVKRRSKELVLLVHSR